MIGCFTAFLLGIVFISLGATHNVIVLAVLGAPMAMIGFYGIPFSSLIYAKYVGVKRVMSTVIEKKINSVSAISRETGSSEAVVRSALLIGRKNGWLNGYYIVGERLADGKICGNSNPVAYKCDCCGAPFVLPEYDETPRCPYCGSFKNSK